MANNKLAMVPSNPLRVSEVFVPGRFPEYTYNPRSELKLEQELRDYLEETGAILAVAGPTKTGKSVLLRNVVDNPIWIESQGIVSSDSLWQRVGDRLGIYTSEETADTLSSSGEWNAGASGGFAPLFTANAGYKGSDGFVQSGRRAITRPISSVVLDALIEAGRPVIVDDFHFIDSNVQREVVRALKPIVFNGLPVVFASISHRVQDVITAEPDMSGRVRQLMVPFWSPSDLSVIAEQGFGKS